MNVLSLFDGMSCGQLALQRIGITNYRYYASEIDKYAIQVTQRNFPDTVQLGDVKAVNAESLPKIDLLLAGRRIRHVEHSTSKRRGGAGRNNATA